MGGLLSVNLWRIRRTLLGRPKQGSSAEFHMENNSKFCIVDQFMPELYAPRDNGCSSHDLENGPKLLMIERQPVCWLTTDRLPHKIQIFIH
ncbi:hypothetical protein DCC85_21215 [Paenibacillus sp. CAA11]|nr:hypothetical protein DCC85_21215 [Paenibacillus sp. CAA11]